MMSDSEEEVSLRQNAAYCSQCDLYLVSCRVHDFRGCRHGFVDGGLLYARGGGNLKRLILYTSSSRDEFKEKLLWGSYGKNGDEPLKRKLMKHLETDHLKAILETQTYLDHYRKQAIQDILTEREEKHVKGDVSS